VKLSILHTLLGVSLPFFAATVWAIVDAALRDFGTTGRKAFWMLVAAVPFIGVLIYLIFGLRRGKRPAIDKNID
jgi:hypothetical protein